MVQANGVNMILHQYSWSTVKLLSRFMYFHTELCSGKFVDSVLIFLFNSCNVFKQAFLFVIISQNDLLKAVFKLVLGTHFTKYGDPEYEFFLSLNPN